MQSVTCSNTAYIGLFGILLSVPIFLLFGLSPVHSAVLVMLLGSLPSILVDVFVNRVYLRPSTGLVWSDTLSVSWYRIRFKLWGLFGTCAILWGAVHVFREYQGGFYQPVYDLIASYGFYAGVLAVPYVVYVDRRMVSPRDSLYWAGRFLAGRWSGVPWPLLGQYWRGVLVKAFFFPLMFIYLVDSCRSMDRLVHDLLAGSYVLAVSQLVHFLYFIDVAVVAPAYLLALRLLDAHVRSVEPTSAGWLVALVCYQPFWSVLDRGYLGYGDGLRWHNWLGQGSFLAYVWGAVIVLLVAVYVWASVSIGYRFSNLTHRGIVTIGPYRWIAHPAYISKNLSWWLTEVPWFNPDPFLAVANCIKLALVGGIYYLRAKTEEQHLASVDSVYGAYLASLAFHRRKGDPACGACLRPVDGGADVPVTRLIK